MNVSIFLSLIKEFFQIGIFSFGGGLATLPFLFDISERYGWYSPQDLSQMIAVASVTPGPIGINVATYAGLKTSGVLGALLATSSVVLPAFFIVIFVSKLLKKYKENFYVKSLLETLKPTSCALLSVVALQLIYATLIKQTVNQSSSIVLFLGLLFLCLTRKKDALFYIFVSIIVGLAFVSLGLLK